MTVVEQLVQIANALGPDEQRRLLSVAVQLREGAGPDLSSMPAAGTDALARDRWRDLLQAQQATALLAERDRLVRLGLIDEAWIARTDALPQDMLPTSDSSVET